MEIPQRQPSQAEKARFDCRPTRHSLAVGKWCSRGDLKLGRNPFNSRGGRPYQAAHPHSPAYAGGVHPSISAVVGAPSSRVPDQTHLVTPTNKKRHRLSQTVPSGGKRTPIELFLHGVAGWDAAAKRQFDNDNPLPG